MLIGDTDAGMYFHNDHLAAASWQAAVVGRKRWVLCRNEDTDIFRGRAGMKPDAQRLPIDAFEPDLERFPRFAEAHCADVVCPRARSSTTLPTGTTRPAASTPSRWASPA